MSPESSDLTTISVSSETHSKLKELKHLFRADSLDETINRLIDERGS